MTRKQIEEAQATLPSRRDVAYNSWTKEQKTLDEELSCREMINSILVYGSNPRSEYNNRYMDRHRKALGEARVEQLIDEQMADFAKAKVIKGVYTDNEDVTYNSCIWEDEQ